jgi:hypothetical protein
MQLVRPDMLPLISVFIMLFLTLVGIIGLMVLHSGIKSLRQKKRTAGTIGKIVLGCFSIGFVLYNWIGYQLIFSENEQLIIGEYRSQTTSDVLKVNPDNTWELKGNPELSCKRGTWEYVMSEDWCYWNIESENMRCNTRDCSPNTIVFKNQQLTFERIK